MAKQINTGMRWKARYGKISLPNEPNRTVAIFYGQTTDARRLLIAKRNFAINVLVIDEGGTYTKVLATGEDAHREFSSESTLMRCEEFSMWDQDGAR